MAQPKSPSSELEVAALAELSAAESLFVGQVIESCAPTNPARAITRWRTADGQLHEQTLTIVKGLTVASGDLVLLQRPSNWPEWMITQVVQGPDEFTLPSVPELLADGKRVHLEAFEEIELRCGKASITLRSNGRLIIRGAYVEIHASGTNRIKGGSVLIN
jgi:hypothetical protein